MKQSLSTLLLRDKATPKGSIEKGEVTGGAFMLHMQKLAHLKIGRKVPYDRRNSRFLRLEHCWWHYKSVMLLGNVYQESHKLSNPLAE